MAASTGKPSRSAIAPGGQCDATTSSASVKPRAAATRDFCGATAPTPDSMSARIALNGVSRAIRGFLESTSILGMIRTNSGFDDSRIMAEKTLNLRGLKCPLPALRARKALGGMQTGDILIVECTDPLAGIDIPNLLNQTGDTLEQTCKEKGLMSFRIRKE